MNSNPVASTTKTADAKATPGARPSRRPARYVESRRDRPILPSSEPSPQDSMRTTRKEAPRITSVGPKSSSGSIDPWPAAGATASPLRSCASAKRPTGKTTSSTGARASAGRASRDVCRRSAMIVRRTAGIDGSHSTSAPAAAAAAPNRTELGETVVGNPNSPGRGPFVRPAKRARRAPIAMPIGRASAAASRAWSPCAKSSVLVVNPRECKTASSNDCRETSNTPTPASTTRVTTRICRRTSRIGTRRSETERWTPAIKIWIPLDTCGGCCWTTNRSLMSAENFT